MVLPTGAESDADSVSIAETEIMDSPGSPYPEVRDDGRVSVQCEEDLFLRNGDASASARRRRSIPPPILPNRRLESRRPSIRRYGASCIYFRWVTHSDRGRHIRYGSRRLRECNGCCTRSGSRFL